MERPVEIAVFDRGELQSVRVLSLRRERWAALLAATTGGALVLLAMAAVAAVLTAFDQVVHAGTFIAVWLTAAAGVGGVFASWARTRLGRYRLGADIEADAFAMAEIDLVRRAGDDYEIGLCSGMTGAFEHRHSVLPVEALIRKAPVYVPMPPTGRVRVEVGNSTFVISRKAAPVGRPFPLTEWVTWLAAGPVRTLLRSAALGTPLAVAMTMVVAVPAAYALDDVDGRRGAASADNEAMARALRVRLKAQYQTRSLHQCFDPLPLECQRSGFVAVGLEISRQGNVTSHWTARSSYGDDCPVTSCMENVVAGWSFEAMPESMTVVLPIQVARTQRAMALDGQLDSDARRSGERGAALPHGGLASWGEASAVFMEMSDGGVGCRDSQ